MTIETRTAAAITPVLCRRHGPGGIVRCFVITREGASVLIDTGFSADDVPLILDALAAAGSSPRQVQACVITHFHRDHVGGLAGLRPLIAGPVIAHAADVAAIEEQTGVTVDQTVAGGTRLDYCGGLQVLHVPGHSPGSIALYSEPDHALFAGDTIFSGGGHLMPSPGYLSDDPQAAVEAAKSLARLPWPVEHVFVAHGEEVYHTGQRNLARLLIDRRNF